MWWLNRRKKPQSQEGAKARAEAEWHLEEAESKWDEVREVSESLQRMKKQNNFGAAIEKILKGDAR